MAVRTDKLPYGVGRLGRGWLMLVVALLVLIGLGIYAYSLQLTEGEVVTGMRDIGTMGGAAWGLYIAFVVYFIGVSFAGITIAALIRLFGLEHLKPVARIAELLTIISLILGAFSIIADLGQPLRGVVNLFRYARPQSPFFGTFTLVIAGYLFASLVYFYLDGRRDAALMAQVPGQLQGLYRLWAAGYKDTPAERKRHEQASFWLAVGIVPLLVVAHSTLGFVFGLQVGRPGWFGTLQAPGFVIMAGISGVGMLIVVAALLRRALGAEEQLDQGIFEWLGKLLMSLIVVYLYFMVVEWLTTTYAAGEHEAQVSAALFSGEYAWLFWGAVVSLVLALGALLLPRLPAPVAVRLPAFQPQLARVTGAVVLALIVVLFGREFLVQREVATAVATTTGPNWLTWLPWLLLAALALFGLSLFPLVRRNVIASAVVSGVLVNVAAIGKRYLIAVPSQTHGTLMNYPPGSYSPTWVEYSIILGLFGLGTLLYVLFIKVFPILELPKQAEGGES